MVSVDHFSLGGINTYKRSSMTRSTVILELADTHVDREKCLASFGIEATEQEVLSEVYIN